MHEQTLFINIDRLVNVREKNELLRGKALAELPVLEDAYLLVEDGMIAGFGKMHDLEINMPQLPKNVMDVSGQSILPCWCDSHTHLVLPAAAKMNSWIR